MGRVRTSTDPATLERYLAALVKLGNRRAACGAIRGSYGALHSMEIRDEAFAEQVREALDRHAAELTEHALELARNGIAEPIFDRNGNEVGEKRKIPVALLLRCLERLDNEGRWTRTSKVEHEHGGRVEHAARVSLDNLTPEQERAARAFLASLQDDGEGADGKGDSVPALEGGSGDDEVVADFTMAPKEQSHDSE